MISEAWAAGLFEGEGYIAQTQYRYVLELQMTDEDIVRRFADVVGVGTVSGPCQHKARTRPYWRWSVSNRKGSVYVLAMFFPYLGERRRGLALEKYPELPEFVRQVQARGA